MFGNLTDLGMVEEPLWQFQHNQDIMRTGFGSLQIYANGVEAQTTLLRGGTVTSIFPTPDPIRISGFQASASNPTLHFFGFVDEVGLYDRALAAAEVQTLFNARSAGKCLPGGGGGGQLAGDPTHPSSPTLQLAGMTAHQAGSGSAFSMSWTAPVNRRFLVEMSTDLAQWEVVPVEITEATPGVYRAALPSRPDGSAFFRLKTND